MEKKKLIAIGIILLFLGITTLPFISSCSAESDEYYFEDVYVFVTGRCRSIFTMGEWNGGLLVGNQSFSAVTANDSFLERLNVLVFEQNKSSPCFLLKHSKNTTVNLINTDGVFFWGCRKHISWRLFPPVILVFCYTKTLRIIVINN